MKTIVYLHFQTNKNKIKIQIFSNLIIVIWKLNTREKYLSIHKTKLTYYASNFITKINIIEIYLKQYYFSKPVFRNTKILISNFSYDFLSGANSLNIQPFNFPSNSAIGKRVSVTCTPLTGEKMEFKWLHNGQEIVLRRQNINIASLHMFSNLIIDPLTPEDSGNYTCVVSARGLTGSFTTNLEVLSKYYLR